MTADEFLQRHVDDDGIELVDGQIVSLPFPGLRHGEVCGTVAYLLGRFIEANHLGRSCSNNSFIRLSNVTVRGPDVLYVSYQTLPADVRTPRGAIRPPLELVAEVRSSESVRDMVREADEYLDAGIEVVLLFDPDTASIGVFRDNELPQRFSNGDEFTLPDVLPGFAVPVREFFE